MTSLDWSPDNKRLALDLGPPPGIYLLNLDGSGLKLIARNGQSPRWSPDGKTLLYAKNDGRGVMAVDAGGGKPRLLRRTRAVWSATWSPDSTRIAYFEVDGLHILRLADRRDRLVSRMTAVCGGRFACFDIDW